MFNMLNISKMSEYLRISDECCSCGNNGELIYDLKCEHKIYSCGNCWMTNNYRLYDDEDKCIYCILLGRNIGSVYNIPMGEIVLDSLSNINELRECGINDGLKKSVSFIETAYFETNKEENPNNKQMLDIFRYLYEEFFFIGRQKRQNRDFNSVLINYNKLEIKRYLPFSNDIITIILNLMDYDISILMSFKN